MTVSYHEVVAVDNSQIRSAEAGDIIAVRPPSISASSMMGGAILLGTRLSGLQGLRGPLGWEPAEAASTNNVVSKAAGVDIGTAVL